MPRATFTVGRYRRHDVAGESTMRLVGDPFRCMELARAGRPQSVAFSAHHMIELLHDEDAGYRLAVYGGRGGPVIIGPDLTPDKPELVSPAILAAASAVFRHIREH